MKVHCPFCGVTDHHATENVHQFGEGDIRFQCKPCDQMFKIHPSEREKYLEQEKENWEYEFRAVTDQIYALILNTLEDSINEEDFSSASSLHSELETFIFERINI